ncbi:hypothetical protein TMO_0847 [Tistrella mobilis KA081020-065]|uniref:Uncharacterized protein n=1 Tax=Tistrella mobilis (strain KA081020-065) TaxID=1110502 RepID=I3TIU8_TISMK|nr:hypothetical protein TMO_0847 [Tistrella mobilis KA081020-065]
MIGRPFLCDAAGPEGKFGFALPEDGRGYGIAADIEMMTKLACRG